jgi:uncharacterized membrane protein (UPF0127 family)
MDRELAPRLRRLPLGTELGLELPVASGPRARLLGLAFLDREAVGAGLFLPRCASVHTFGMRFVLDLIFLDAHRKPIAIHRNVPPRRLVFCCGAASVIERPAAGPSR